MRYYIGLSIPQNKTTKINYIKDTFNQKNLFDTSVMLIPPHMLPNDDIFVKNLIEVCQRIKPFNFELCGLEHNNKIIYLKIQSKTLKLIRNEIIHNLDLKDYNKHFVPHIIIYKNRYITNRNYNKVKMLTDKFFPETKKYKCTNIIVYQQSQSNYQFKPYIKINIE